MPCDLPGVFLGEGRERGSRMVKVASGKAGVQEIPELVEGWLGKTKKLRVVTFLFSHRKGSSADEKGAPEDACEVAW